MQVDVTQRPLLILNRQTAPVTLISIRELAMFSRSAAYTLRRVLCSNADLLAERVMQVEPAMAVEHKDRGWNGVAHSIPAWIKG